MNFLQSRYEDTVHVLTMSARFLVLLGVCALVGVQAQDDRILNCDRTTEDDLRVLVQQLTDRVQKLEKENNARGQSAVKLLHRRCSYVKSQTSDWF